MQFENLFHKDLAMASILYVDLIGIKCVDLDNLSTTTMIESCCFTVIRKPVINPWRLFPISILELEKDAINLLGVFAQL